MTLTFLRTLLYFGMHTKNETIHNHGLAGFLSSEQDGWEFRGEGREPSLRSGICE